MALGIYDGVHLGHQKLLRRLLELSESMEAEASLLTFCSDVPKPGFERIMNQDQLHRHLHHHGLRHLYTIPFSYRLKAMSAREFLQKVLVEKLQTRALVLGEDARFGKDRLAGAAEITELGSELGIHVEVLSMEALGGAELSSTLVRQRIREGSFTDLEELLGQPYAVGGTVVHDQHLGSELGFPTANLEVEGRVLPPDGVYAGEVNLFDGHDSFRAMIYIGQRPSRASAQRVVEAHLLDFDGDLYGRYIEICPQRFIRGEIRFDSLEALKRQLELDREKVLVC